MKKALLVGFAAIFLVGGGYLGLKYFGVFDTPKSINGLIAHFKSNDLSVFINPAPTKEEQGLIDAGNLMMKALGPDANPTFTDFKDMTIDSVPVKVTLFKDDNSAKEAYDFLVQQEEHSTRYAAEDGRTHNKKEYLLNGKFVLTIRYYDVTLNNGWIQATALNLDSGKVNAVKQAFMSY